MTMTLSAGFRLGAYDILAAIGAGGMGEVYRARDTKLGREVAIKVLPAAFALDAERVARFKREAQVLASLNHPHIAQIYGLEEANGTQVLVMELVDGESLDKRIARGPIPIDDALPIAKQIAEALEAAHEKGIIHRDLKPANIALSRDGQVKVLDFGLAKAVAASAEASPYRPDLANSPTITSPAMLSGVGVILGTAAYMSPEQARGSIVDRRADIWAFGAVFYEMLTGTRLFEGGTISDTLAAVLRAEPDWRTLPTDMPMPIRRLLRRCLEKDRSERLADAGDARLEIADAVTVPAPDRSPAADVTPSPRGARLTAIMSLVAGALVASLATWLLMRSAPPAPAPLIRLSADLGPDAVRGPQMTVAISADGRRIVFPVRSADGSQKLATRLLDQATPTVLPGTEGGLNPFFSPDGQWVAFGADDKLKKVSVLGGAAVILCDAPAFRGGSWGEDGTIVAALNINTGLSRVPAAGGSPQPLTKLVNGEVSHRWPQILPGGQAVLFSAATSFGAWEEASVEVLTANTGQVTTVARAGYFGRYMAGHLTYLHEGVLFGVPFDLGRLSVRGAPVPLIDDVASDPGTAGGQFAVSHTGTFVYRGGVIASAYPVVWLDNEGKTQPLLPTPGRYFTPRISPDGRRLALSMFDRQGQDVVVYDIRTQAMSRLTFNGRENLNPVWTPDGSHLVYASGRDHAIWWTRADGAGEPQRLLESKNGSVEPSSFSPDGRYLSYTETSNDTRRDLWVLPIDSSDTEHPKAGTPEVFLKTPVNESGGTFSPDGRWLAYASEESGLTQVYVRPFHHAGGGKWQISAKLGEHSDGGAHPFWSRDGHRLYYLSLGNQIIVLEYTAAGDSFTATIPHIWSKTRVRYNNPNLPPLDLAPDGRRFVVLPEDTVADDKGSVHATFLLNFFDYMRTIVSGNK